MIDIGIPSQIFVAKITLFLGPQYPCLIPKLRNNIATCVLWGQRDDKGTGHARSFLGTINAEEDDLLTPRRLTLCFSKKAPSSYSNTLCNSALIANDPRSTPSCSATLSRACCKVSFQAGFRISNWLGFNSHVFRTVESTYVSVPFPKGAWWHNWHNAAASRS